MYDREDEHMKCGHMKHRQTMPAFGTETFIRLLSLKNKFSNCFLLEFSSDSDIQGAIIQQYSPTFLTFAHLQTYPTQVIMREKLKEKGGIIEFKKKQKNKLLKLK